MSRANALDATDRLRALADQASRFGFELRIEADRIELHDGARRVLRADDLAHAESFLRQYHALAEFCRPTFARKTDDPRVRKRK